MPWSSLELQELAVPISSETSLGATLEMPYDVETAPETEEAVTEQARFSAGNMSSKPLSGFLCRRLRRLCCPPSSCRGPCGGCGRKPAPCGASP